MFAFTRLKEGEDQKEISIEPAQALDEVEPLPEDFYTRPVSLPEGKLPSVTTVSTDRMRAELNLRVFPVTTLRQRLLQPDFQPAGASQLHPRHKHLLMKRSLRCRVSAALCFLLSVTGSCCCCCVDNGIVSCCFFF